VLRTFIVAIALTSPALATPIAGTATLAAAATVATVTSESGRWTCTGTSCTGSSDSLTGPAVATCTTLADRAGRVTAFTAGATSFGAAEMARCNRHVK
jgi:hypothetical protein